MRNAISSPSLHGENGGVEGADTCDMVPPQLGLLSHPYEKSRKYMVGCFLSISCHMKQDLLVTDAFYIKYLQHSMYTLLHGIV